MPLVLGMGKCKQHAGRKKTKHQNKMILTQTEFDTMRKALSLAETDNNRRAWDILRNALIVTVKNFGSRKLIKKRK